MNEMCVNEQQQNKCPVEAFIDDFQNKNYEFVYILNVKLAAEGTMVLTSYIKADNSNGVMYFIILLDEFIEILFIIYKTYYL